MVHDLFTESHPSHVREAAVQRLEILMSCAATYEPGDFITTKNVAFRGHKGIRVGGRGVVVVVVVGKPPALNQIQRAGFCTIHLRVLAHTGSQSFSLQELGKLRLQRLFPDPSGISGSDLESPTEPRPRVIGSSIAK